MAAYVRLNEAGLDPVSEPGPWEFLARQSQGAGFGELAHLLRMALWQAGHRTPELALNEAQYSLSQSEFDTARALLTEVFGETPDDATVRYALAQSLAPSDPEAALAAMGDTPAAGPDAQLLRIELLRELDRLKEATDETRAAVARFPDDPRFAVRAARIMESRNDWKAALGWWKTVTETAAGSARSQALWNLARLHLRLENEAEAVAAAARHLAAAPPLSEALATAQLMEQERLGLNLLADAAETARYGQHGAGAVAAVEWGRVARFLLGQGRIGLLAWLWRQNLPLGDLARAVLGGAAFSPDDLGQIGAGIVAAARLRSPDYLLPDVLAELRDHAPPAVAGAPVLLVNSTLAAGGAERQLVMLVRALLSSGLAKARLHVALFSVAGDRGHAHFLPELKQLGVTVHVLDRRAARAEATLPRTGRDFVAVLPTQLRSDVVALWPLVRALRPAVLHGWQDRSSLAAGVVGVLEHTPRVVMSARNMEPGKRAGLAARPSAALYRTLIDLPGVTLTANSEAGARDYEAWLGLEGGRCPVIRNAIEIERFPAPAKPPRRGRPKPRQVRILGCSGWRPTSGRCCG
ncbi:MAG: hypothetical protein R3D84_12860 [Paracoccaceae bacterium]